MKLTKRECRVLVAALHRAIDWSDEEGQIASCQDPKKEKRFITEMRKVRSKVAGIKEREGE